MSSGVLGRNLDSVGFGVLDAVAAPEAAVLPVIAVEVVVEPDTVQRARERVLPLGVSGYPPRRSTSAILRASSREPFCSRRLRPNSSATMTAAPIYWPGNTGATKTAGVQQRCPLTAASAGAVDAATRGGPSARITKAFVEDVTNGGDAVACTCARPTVRSPRGKAEHREFVMANAEDCGSEIREPRSWSLHRGYGPGRYHALADHSLMPPSYAFEERLGPVLGQQAVLLVCRQCGRGRGRSGRRRGDGGGCGRRLGAAATAAGGGQHRLTSARPANAARR